MPPLPSKKKESAGAALHARVSHPAQALTSLRRLSAVARRTGEDVGPDVASVEAALSGLSVVDDVTVDRVARRLWGAWRNVDQRGFSATSLENRARWREIARAALEVLGHRTASDRFPDR